MARHARLSVAGEAHLVWQRGHNGAAVIIDGDDRQALRGALGEAAGVAQVRLHAFALLETELLLLATPVDALSLGRFMQVLGRRYVAAFNRRHGRTGTLWDGRFRCAVVEPGARRLEALLIVDASSAAHGVTSAAHRTGAVHDPMLSDPPEYWALGNTPFEREAAWRTWLARGPDAGARGALLRAAAGGWAYGSAAFAANVSAQVGRPASPGPRGRPPRPGA